MKCHLRMLFINLKILYNLIYLYNIALKETTLSKLYSIYALQRVSASRTGFKGTLTYFDFMSGLKTQNLCFN